MGFWLDVYGCDLGIRGTVYCLNMQLLHLYMGLGIQQITCKSERHCCLTMLVNCNLSAVCFLWQGRTHNLTAAVLNCDRGYSTETLMLLQTLRLPSQPISTILFSQSIYNSSSAASTAFGWHNTSCIQGSALQLASDAVSGSQYGCPAEFEAACFADLQQHILNDDDYFFALYVPGNFSANFAAALTDVSDRGAAYMQMSMNYVYPQVTSLNSMMCDAAKTVLQHCYTEETVLKSMACTVQGRSYSTYALITSVLTTVINSISTTLGYTVAANDAITAVSPNFYIAPIILQSFNLAPVRTSGMNFSTYVICVLMWLGCTFIVSAMYPFGTKAEEALLANIRKQGVLDYKRKQVSTPFSSCNCH